MGWITWVVMIVMCIIFARFLYKQYRERQRGGDRYMGGGVI